MVARACLEASYVSCAGIHTQMLEIYGQRNVAGYWGVKAIIKNTIIIIIIMK